MSLLAYSANAENAAEWPTPVAKPWPAADELFHRDARWRGGDGATSVDLGDGRVLWLFGDSFVSNKVPASRKQTKMINNTVGIQVGYDPCEASLECFWNTIDDEPSAFFAANRRVMVLAPQAV